MYESPTHSQSPDRRQVLDSLSTPSIARDLSRRSLLGGVATGIVGLAGCIGTGKPQETGNENDPGGSAGNSVALTASLSMTPVTETEIARRFALESDRPLLKRLATNGSTTVEAVQPPLEASATVGPYIYEDTLYQISYEITGKRKADRYRVEINSVEGSVAEENTIAFGKLPAVDREKLAGIGLRDVNEDQILGIATTFAYSETERKQSALVPSPTHSVIVWDSGRRARVAITESGEETVNTYHYTAETVAPAREYGQDVRERHGFQLSGLSDAERQIVQEAIESESGYQFASPDEEPEATPTAALRALVERFRPHDPFVVPENGAAGTSAGVEGKYLVRYNGRVYWTELHIDEDEFNTETATEEANGTAG
jgi:hypothetical protein